MLDSTEILGNLKKYHPDSKSVDEAIKFILQQAAVIERQAAVIAQVDGRADKRDAYID